jgi:hypothetical protein
MTGASRRQTGTDAASIAAVLPPHPRAASSRPEQAISRHRRSRRLGPPRTTRSALRLKLAPSSPCPHCDRTTKTVQGVCADCWGSKGGRQVWGTSDQGWPFEISPLLIGASVALVPAVILVIAWILV